MLDIQFIRENTQKVKKGIAAKQLEPSLVDKVLELDELHRKKIVEYQEKHADWRIEQKKTEKLLFEKGEDEARKQTVVTKKLKKDVKTLWKEVQETALKRRVALLQIPNLPADDVPLGKDESGNKVLRKWGELKNFDFKPKDHLELGEALDIIDVKRAAKVSGARFNYLKGDAAKLQFALIQFVFEILTDQKIVKEIAKSVGNPSDKTFVPVIPPAIAKSAVMKKMARFDPIEERYYLEKDDALLVGSAEHTLGPMHMDEVLAEKDLPIRYLGYSPSFRREAGTYGKDTKGILRVHQFDKVEMESFTTPENSDKEQDFFVAIQEYLMKSLEIPYQVVIICTGDMGAPDYRQIDIEAWLPGQGKYRETHTSDHMADYQSRRLNTKVQRESRSEFVHMNDATAFAIGRTIIAILENYQEKEGSVTVPEVLRKWMGKEKIEVK